jgi:hypothetical protein
MSDAPNLDALLGENPRRRGAGPAPRWSPEVTAARRAEQMRRAVEVERLAKMALARLHPDEYDALHKQAKARVLAERGPLPGDEVSDG